jgi:hypothetical protein
MTGSGADRRRSSLLQIDDFILWVTIGIILGGRTGYVLFYNLPFFVQHPAEIFELWKGGMSFHGGFLGCVAAVILFCRQNKPADPVARRHHHRGRTDRAVSRTPRQFHQQRVVGPAGRLQRALGDGVSQWRAAAAPSQPALRGGARGYRAVYHPGGDDQARRPEAAGPDPRQLHRDLRLCAYHRRVFQGARPAARIFVGRTDHGHAAVGADDYCRVRSLLWWHGAASRRAGAETVQGIS